MTVSCEWFERTINGEIEYRYQTKKNQHVMGYIRKANQELYTVVVYGTNDGGCTLYVHCSTRMSELKKTIEALVND
jgi:mevalonate pyrophosphate decarboxylase